MGHIGERGIYYLGGYNELKARRRKEARLRAKLKKAVPGKRLETLLRQLNSIDFRIVVLEANRAEVVKRLKNLGKVKK